jgi:prefoldin beta subunit
MSNPNSTLTTEADAELAKYRLMQDSIQKARTQQQTLLQQLNENEMVFTELKILGPEDKVSKLIGPVLMTVSKEEALETVEKRVEFIQAELKKMETQIASKEADAAALVTKIQNMQGDMQKRAKEEAMKIAQRSQGGGEEEDA